MQRQSSDSLDRLLESVNDSARHFRAVYTFYLVVAFYILVVAASTSTELLFRAGDVQMPIVSVQVPIVSFFIFVPWLVLILHLNLLIQAEFLSKKTWRYLSALPTHTSSERTKTEALTVLFPVPLVHTVAQKDQTRSTQPMLRTFVVVSIILLPLGILVPDYPRF